MMSIAAILDAIKHAIYGQDVRTAIHDGIAQCYEDVATAKTLADNATASANTAAGSANTAAGTANTAASNADAKATLANTAASNADAKATLANDKATLANDAANYADSKATLAAQKAALANGAALNADTKAALANTAASNADAKATLANDAAINADAKATLANTAAENANQTIEDLQDLVDGKSAYQIWLDAGHVGTQTDFLASLVGPEGPEGPEGPIGNIGVHIGPDVPTTEGMNLWIDTDDDSQVTWDQIANKPTEFPTPTKNDLSTIVAGFSLDSRQGKALNDKIAQLSNPNLLINGDFQVWQRGTSFSTTGSDRYTADRWLASWSLPSVTKIPGGSRVQFSDAWQAFQQKLDNLFIRSGDKVTISTILKSSVARQLTIYFNVNDAIIDSITCNATTEFTLYSKTFTLTSNATSLGVTMQNTTALTSDVDIQYIKLEMGSVATPNVSRPYAEELALCQRYYFEEFSPIQHSYACFLATELTSLQGSIKFPVTMRITPTFTITSLRSNKDGSQGTFATWSTQINKHGINAIFNFTFSPSYTIIQGTMYTINFKADAEIY